MSWSDLDDLNGADAYQKQAREKQAELARLFHRVFSTDDGRKLLEHLTHKFVFNNDTPFTSQNIEYESGYHAGEAGVVKMIIHQITAAEDL